MVAPTQRTLLLGLMATHWIAELMPLQETASRVVRLIVLSVETLWFLWEYRHWVKHQRSTGPLCPGVAR
jgi:hypothetical protein